MITTNNTLTKIKPNQIVMSYSNRWWSKLSWRFKHGRYKRPHKIVMVDSPVNRKWNIWSYLSTNQLEGPTFKIILCYAKMGSWGNFPTKQSWACVGHWKPLFPVQIFLPDSTSTKPAFINLIVSGSLRGIRKEKTGVISC